MPMFSLNVPLYIAVGYFCIISITASLITIYDKLISMKKGKKMRIPEAALIFIACIGGCLAMLITMLIIRHKTQHSKFMIGLPIILFMQAIVVIYILVNYTDIEFRLM